MFESDWPGLGLRSERCMTWTRSSRSHPGNNCVEVQLCARTVRVRDSKQAVGPVLSFGNAAWSSFLVDLMADDPCVNVAARHVRETRFTLLGEGR